MGFGGELGLLWTLFGKRSQIVGICAFRTAIANQRPGKNKKPGHLFGIRVP